MLRSDEDLAKNEFGQTELSLGIAVNRDIQSKEGLNGTTRVYYSDSGGTVTIDIENDPLLATFLETVKNHAPRSSPEKITKTVVAMTPKLDETGAYHMQRATILGQALAEPVECVDRALAFEASLKMLGVVNDAEMLISIDRYSNGESANHTDLIFSIGDVRYVAITTGKRAGEVMTFEKYKTEYLQEREALGLGKREIKNGWGHSYFQQPH